MNLGKNIKNRLQEVSCNYGELIHNKVPKKILINTFNEIYEKTYDQFQPSVAQEIYRIKNKICLNFD